jgi:hypothetical protein
MALTTVNITGTFNLPDATWTDYAQAEFLVSGYDTDTEVVVPSVIKSNLSSTGALDVDLWANDDGLRGTVYRVHVNIYTNNSYATLVKSVDFGNIQVTSAADIATLLDAPVTVPGVWYSTITEAEYDAAIAAQTAAEAAQTGAETAQTGAEAAQIGAEAAQAAAEAAQTGAETARTGAETAQTAAEAAQTAAEAVLVDPGFVAVSNDLTGADTIGIVAENMDTVVDISTGLTNIHITMLQMSTAFTNSQTRYVEAHAFS